MKRGITSILVEQNVHDWPAGIPPGLVTLLCDEDPDIRTRATAIVSACSLADDLQPSSMFSAVFTQLVDQLDASFSPSLRKGSFQLIPTTPAICWAAMPTILSRMSSRAMQSTVQLREPSLSHVITSHLSDKDQREDSSRK